MSNKEYISNKIQKQSPITLNTTTFSPKNLPTPNLTEMEDFNLSEHLQQLTTNLSPKLSPKQSPIQAPNLLKIDTSITQPDFPFSNPSTPTDLDNDELWEHHLQLAILCAFSYFPLSDSGQKKDDFNQAKQHFDYVLSLLTQQFEREQYQLITPFAFIEFAPDPTYHQTSISVKSTKKKKKKSKKKKKKKLKTSVTSFGNSQNKSDLKDTAKNMDKFYVKRKSLEFKKRFQALEIFQAMEMENLASTNCGYNTDKKSKKKKRKKTKKGKKPKEKIKRASSTIISQARKERELALYKNRHSNPMPQEKKLETKKNQVSNPRNYHFKQLEKKNGKLGFVGMGLKQSETPTIETGNEVSFDLLDEKEESISEMLKKYTPGKKLRNGSVVLGYAYGSFLYDLEEYNESLKLLLLCCEWYKKDFPNPTCNAALILPLSALLYGDSGIPSINFRSLACFVNKVFNKLQKEYDKDWGKYNVNILLQHQLDGTHYSDTDVNDEFVYVQYGNKKAVIVDCLSDEDKPSFGLGISESSNESNYKESKIHFSLLPIHCRELIKRYQELSKNRWQFGKKCWENCRALDAKQQFRTALTILEKIYCQPKWKNDLKKDLEELQNEMKNKPMSKRQRMLARRKRAQSFDE